MGAIAFSGFLPVVPHRYALTPTAALHPCLCRLVISRLVLDGSSHGCELTPRCGVDLRFPGA